ncbi:MAG: hypothetical protein IJR00_01350 [Lachnospiraceae bacterium]|nr:hypothetical protein [Lachnospiraceae bacterium]
MKNENLATEILKEEKAVLIWWRTAFFATAAAWGITIIGALICICR